MGKYTRSKRTRSRSRYPMRLKKRGLSKSPVMKTLDVLRRQQRADSSSFDNWSFDVID